MTAEPEPVPKNLKPRAVVSPTTRTKAPTDVQWYRQPLNPQPAGQSVHNAALCKYYVYTQMCSGRQ